jgi:hypothetical protein
LGQGVSTASIAVYQAQVPDSSIFYRREGKKGLKNAKRSKINHFDNPHRVLMKYQQDIAIWRNSSSKIQINPLCMTLPVVLSALAVIQRAISLWRVDRFQVIMQQSLPRMGYVFFVT